MKQFEIGKLYRSTYHHLFVYSSWEAVMVADDYTDSTSRNTASFPATNEASIFEAIEEAQAAEEQWWVRHPIKVFIHPAYTPMMVVQMREYKGQTFAKIISGSKAGWIMCRNWLTFDKLV